MCLYKTTFKNQQLAEKIIKPHSDMSFAGILCGNNTGEVWVDDFSEPSFCLVWSEFLNGFCFMGSKPNHMDVSQFRTFINNTIIPFLADRNLDYFEFSCESSEWLSLICDSMPNLELKQSKQFVYKLMKKEDINMSLTLPDSYYLLEIDSNFINDTLKSIKNGETIRTEITKSWDSIEKFLKNGKGFAAMKDNEICGFAMTYFRYKDTYSIGVETFENFKQKGLSAFLSAVLFGSILNDNDNANIRWDCMESNIASQKTAMKAGLTFDHEYPVYWFDI